MKRIISIVFITLYASLLLKPMTPYLAYYINYNYIVNNLCVNKDKPEMHCNGHCQLAKMVKTETKDDNGQNPRLPKVELDKIQFNNATELSLVKPIIFEQLVKPNCRCHFNSQDITFKIFKPPIFV